MRLSLKREKHETAQEQGREVRKLFENLGKYRVKVRLPSTFTHRFPPPLASADLERHAWIIHVICVLISAGLSQYLRLND